MEGATFIDAGTIEDVRHVDVLDAEGNPLEYGLTLEDARERYGRHPVRPLAEIAED